MQGSTQISSLLVLLYTRIKLAQEQEYRIPNLNSIRLWSLNGDSLVRLSRGTVASNSITPRSILVYTIGKRTGKSHVFTYADASKVKKVAVEVQVSNIWQGKDPSHGVEKVGGIPHIRFCVKFEAV